MTELYGRVITLTVSPPTSRQALDLSQFRIKFQVLQKTIETPNTADIRIYNLKDTTVNLLVSDGIGARVRLSAGYAGASSLIFDGNIVQSKSGRESPVDTFVDLIAADGDIAYNSAVVNGTLAAGSTPGEHLAMAIKAMQPHGVTPGNMPPLSTQVSPRGRALFGMARDTIRDIAISNSCTWSIQNGVLDLLPQGQALPDPALVLTGQTGMIGLPQQTQLGIIVRTLLIPGLKVGARININNKSIQRARIDTSYGGAVNNGFLPRVADDGFYRVLVLDRVGDTRGTPWYAECTCVALGDPLTKALVSRGVNDTP